MSAVSYALLDIVGDTRVCLMDAPITVEFDGEAQPWSGVDLKLAWSTHKGPRSLPVPYVRNLWDATNNLTQYVESRGFSGPCITWRGTFYLITGCRSGGDASPVIIEVERL